MAKTVKEMFDQLKQSQGFVIFTSRVVKNPDSEELTLEHDYIRQQFVPEDLQASFEHFNNMLTKDLADSGLNLIKSAEKIANVQNPLSDKEHTAS